MASNEGPGSPVTWASAYASMGHSATSALRDFREAGGHVRTQTWYQVYGQVSATIEHRAGLAALADEAHPDAKDVGTWKAGREGIHYHQAEVYIRRQGGSDIETFYYTAISDRLRTKGAVLDEAMGYADTFRDSDTFGEFTILGAALSSVSRSVAR